MRKFSNFAMVISCFFFGLSCRSSAPNPFPFVIWNEENVFGISVETESKELYDKYHPLFEKYGYSGNGYSWEGHIRLVLEELDPALIAHIDFDPEAGSFFARADSKASQLRFVEILSPVFSNLDKLEVYLKKADRKRIDD